MYMHYIVVLYQPYTIFSHDESVDESGEMNGKRSRKNLLQLNFSYHEFHVELTQYRTDLFSGSPVFCIEVNVHMAVYSWFHYMVYQIDCFLLAYML
jgi:hypothetical protein